MRKKRILSEEHKEKIRQSKIGKKRNFSEIAIENIRNGASKRRGRKRLIPMGEYQKQRIREANSRPKSEEHKRKIAITLTGRKNTSHSEWMKKWIADNGHPMKGKKTGRIPWNKGKKTRKSTKRNSLITKEWSEAVKERDGKKCTKCGTEKGLHAHHIIPWKDKEELRFDVKNGITLCRSCHAKLEGFQVGHGHRKTNRWTITP
jgi:predicted PP-loop superfamily ATPase